MHLVMSKIRHVNDHVGSLFIWYCIDVIILKVTSECMCKGNWGRTSGGGVSEVYTQRCGERSGWTPEDSEKVL